VSNMKQMIVIRKDLNMRKGKMVAQGAHASMAAILGWVDQGHWHGHAILVPDDRVVEWLRGAFTKVCVAVNSEAELIEIHEKAKDAGLITSIIQDAGKTEFDGVPTYTAVAVGPDTHENLQPLTGELKLL